MYVSAYSGLRARTNPDVQEDNTITILNLNNVINFKYSKNKINEKYYECCN